MKWLFLSRPWIHYVLGCETVSMDVICLVFSQLYFNIAIIYFIHNVLEKVPVQFICFFEFGNIDFVFYCVMVVNT